MRMVSTSKIHVNVCQHSYSILIIFPLKSNFDMIFCYGANPFVDLEQASTIALNLVYVCVCCV